MKINRENYESFFIDYLEGNLDERQVNDFIDWVVLEVDEDGKIMCKNVKKHLKAPIEYVKANGIGKGAKIR